MGESVFVRLIFFVISVVGITNARECDWGEMGTFENSCYIALADQFDFWTAEAKCNSLLGGHLLAINSKEENGFVMNLMQLMETFVWWTGAYKNGDTWEWTSGKYRVTINQNTHF